MIKQKKREKQTRSGKSENPLMVRAARKNKCSENTAEDNIALEVDRIRRQQASVGKKALLIAVKQRSQQRNGIEMTKKTGIVLFGGSVNKRLENRISGKGSSTPASQKTFADAKKIRDFVQSTVSNLESDAIQAGVTIPKAVRTQLEKWRDTAVELVESIDHDLRIDTVAAILELLQEGKINAEDQDFLEEWLVMRPRLASPKSSAYGPHTMRCLGSKLLGKLLTLDTLQKKAYKQLKKDVAKVAIEWLVRQPTAAPESANPEHLAVANALREMDTLVPKDIVDFHIERLSGKKFTK